MNRVIKMVMICGILASILYSVFFAKPEECHEQLFGKCVVTINKAAKSCAMAIETEGVNILADLKCVKSILTEKRHCLPCICKAAHKHNWKLFGCQGQTTPMNQTDSQNETIHSSEPAC